MIIKEVASNFDVKGTLLSYDGFGNGHINDTYSLTYKIDDDTLERYILQRMNEKVFPNIEELMTNIVNVTEYLQAKYESMGEDPKRKCVNIVKTRTHSNYFRYSNGCWRMMYLIEDTQALEIVVDRGLFEMTGRAFGDFIKMLNDYPVDELYETIVDFHNTVARFQNFILALEEDVKDRKFLCMDDIQFVLDNQILASKIVDLLSTNQIPIRVTHNDTKINNILIHQQTGETVCVVDLDTIMPGSLLYDFGDAIRSGCNTALEDEKDLSIVKFDIDMFESFAKGFLEGLGECITPTERDNLAIAAIVITYECGIRFLTDYLKGDVYFKTAYPEHNLIRCRTQFKLVEEMLLCIEDMKAIINKY